MTDSPDFVRARHVVEPIDLPALPPAEPPPLQETLWRARDNHRRLQREVARYIEEMSGALGAMARSAELGLMVYLLDMVRAEAKLQAERPRPSR